MQMDGNSVTSSLFVTFGMLNILSKGRLSKFNVTFPSKSLQMTKNRRSRCFLSDLLVCHCGFNGIFFSSCRCTSGEPTLMFLIRSFPSIQCFTAEPRDNKTAENEKSEFTNTHKYERRNKVTSSFACHTFASDYMTLLASNFPWIRKTINPITPRENWRAGLGGNLLRSYGVLREAEFCGAGYISTHSNSFMASEQKEQSLCGL